MSDVRCRWCVHTPSLRDSPVSTRHFLSQCVRESEKFVQIYLLWRWPHPSVFHFRILLRTRR